LIWLCGMAPGFALPEQLLLLEANLRLALLKSLFQT